MTKIFGVLAHPVDHSLSPVFQNAAFTATNFPGKFLKFDVLPENLERFLKKVRQEKISGLAVSLPHKSEIIKFLDQISLRAKKIGAVNTVFWEKEKLCGDNTDADGFFDAISKNIFPQKKAAVFGAGGAARAIIFILRKNNFEVFIFNRTPQKAEKLANEFGVHLGEISKFLAKDFDLVVNSTSVGLRENVSPTQKSNWREFSGIAFDAVFDPLETKFLQDAKAAGGKIITGEKMLLFQGFRQFEIWTKLKAPKKIMRQSLQKNSETKFEK